MRLRWAAPALLVLATACGGGGSKKTASAASTTTTLATTGTTATPTGYKTPTDVMNAIAAAGIACANQSVDQGGGGAAAIGFCESTGGRLQIATFDNDAGKSAWLDLAGRVGKSFGTFYCAVGSAWAACPQVGNATGQQLAQHIGTALHATVHTY